MKFPSGRRVGCCFLRQRTNAISKRSLLQSEVDFFWEGGRKKRNKTTKRLGGRWWWPICKFWIYLHLGMMMMMMMINNQQLSKFESAYTCLKMADSLQFLTPCGDLHILLTQVMALQETNISRGMGYVCLLEGSSFERSYIWRCSPTQDVSSAPRLHITFFFALIPINLHFSLLPGEGAPQKYTL